MYFSKIITILFFVSLTQSTQIYFIPSYASETSPGQWNVRIQGLIYEPTTDGKEQIPIDLKSDFDNMASEYSNWTPHEQDNFNQRITPFKYDYLDDQKVSVTFNNEIYNLQEETDHDGYFNEFVPNVHLTNTGGKAMYTNPNAVTPGIVILPKTEGYSIVTDIDDVIRVTRVWDPLDGLRNSFVRDYVAVPGIPTVISQWKRILPDPTLHYVTTTPIPLAKAYYDWLSGTYGPGSLDMRPLNIFDPNSILNARDIAVRRLLETFPNRTFIFLGDAVDSNIRTYSDLAKEFSDRVQCVLLRNLSATEDYSNPTISRQLKDSFEGIPNTNWFIYDTSQQLELIDLAGGECHPPGYCDDCVTATPGALDSAPSDATKPVSLTLFLLLSLVCQLKI